MKGLLIKDIKLMKNQKTFFTAMTFVDFLFLITQETPYFVITYITTMFSMFTITTLTYDEFENGSAFLFSLPLSRKDYVKEKYLYGIITCALGLGIVTVATVVVSAIRGQKLDMTSIGATGLASISICIIFLSLSIPIEIKFGVEKGRIGFLLVLGLFFAGFYVAMRFAGNEGRLGVQNIISKIEDLSSVAVIGGVIGIWIIVGLISMLISMGLISRKEY